MKRKHKKYSKPKRPFDKARIEEEAQIVKEYGLKNKKEIWKAEAKIKSMREKAKRFITADESDKKKLFKQLQKIGLNVESLADILSLTKQDYLNRRLQTIVLKKRLAPTAKTARQMITHKKVLVDDKTVNIPSFIVPINLENKITIKLSKMKVEEKPAKKSKDVELVAEEENVEEKPMEESE